MSSNELSTAAGEAPEPPGRTGRTGGNTPVGSGGADVVAVVDAPNISAMSGVNSEPPALKRSSLPSPGPKTKSSGFAATAVGPGVGVVAVAVDKIGGITITSDWIVFAVDVDGVSSGIITADTDEVVGVDEVVSSVVDSTLGSFFLSASFMTRASRGRSSSESVPGEIGFDNSAEISDAIILLTGGVDSAGLVVVSGSTGIETSFTGSIGVSDWTGTDVSGSVGFDSVGLTDFSDVEVGSTGSGVVAIFSVSVSLVDADGSDRVFDAGSTVVVDAGSTVVVDAGSTVVVDAGSTVVVDVVSDGAGTVCFISFVGDILVMIDASVGGGGLVTVEIGGLVTVGVGGLVTVVIDVFVDVDTTDFVLVESSFVSSSFSITFSIFGVFGVFQRGTSSCSVEAICVCFGNCTVLSAFTSVELSIRVDLVNSFFDIVDFACWTVETGFSGLNRATGPTVVSFIFSTFLTGATASAVSVNFFKSDIGSAVVTAAATFLSESLSFFELFVSDVALVGVLVSCITCGVFTSVVVDGTGG